MINVARGELINYNDLIEYLTTCPDVQIVLDVFHIEPLKNCDPLWFYNNVYISPHNAYASMENNVRLFKTIYENLKNNREIKYSFY